MGAPGRMQEEATASTQQKSFRGPLDIRIHPGKGRLTPPGELLVLNPAGKKIGKDPRSGKAYQEIPYAYYEYEGIDDAQSGAPGPKSGIIHIPHPRPGVYGLKVIGRKTGRYRLEITAFDQGPHPFKFLSRSRRIRKNEVHRYSLRYPSEKGAGLKVAPAFVFPERKAK